MNDTRKDKTECILKRPMLFIKLTGYILGAICLETQLKWVALVLQ